MNLLIIGHGRHGKDTVAEILHEEFGLTFSSSSYSAAEIFIYDKLAPKYGYNTFEECYNDRHNHRAEWYALICEYNKEDPARLARGIMKKNDIYVGMRDAREIEECRKIGLFDLIIWVERPSMPEEDRSSFNIDRSLADIVIMNDGSLEDLKRKVMAVGEMITL